MRWLQRTLRTRAGTVIITVPPRHAFRYDSIFRARAHRTLRSCELSRRRADGGCDRSAVPAVVQALRRELRGTEKSRRRMDHEGEPAPVAVQIAGADPAWMADAARENVARGAQIIDINMGCPAKKVCNV